jgi:hypothetical protein
VAVRQAGSADLWAGLSTRVGLAMEAWVLRINEDGNVDARQHFADDGMKSAPTYRRYSATGDQATLSSWHKMPNGDHIEITFQYNHRR